MRICYHGTNEENAQSILKEGFRPKSWFARHLEDAIGKGGTHVFQIAFDDPPDHWQYYLDIWVKPDRIVSYKIYQVEQKVENEDLRKEVFDSPKIPPNRAAAWRSFDYGEWKKLNDKFDHETWNRLMDKGMDDAAELGNSDVDAWVKVFADSRKKAKEACGGSPPIRPNAWYNADGDILEIYLSHEEHYAKWLNHQVSVLLCHKTDEVVGFQIWGLSGVKEITKLVKWFAEKTDEEEKNESAERDIGCNTHSSELPKVE